MLTVREQLNVLRALPMGTALTLPDLRTLWLNRTTIKMIALHTSLASVAHSVQWTVSTCPGQ